MATNGTTLLLQCQEVESHSISGVSKSPYNAGACIGLLEGVALTAEALAESLPTEVRICFPKERLSGLQSTLIILKFLRQNPGELHKPAATLAYFAFSEAFPCRTK